MFNFTSDVVTELLVFMVAIGAFFAYAKAKYGKLGMRIATIFAVLGFLFSVIYATVGLNYRIPKEYKMMLTFLHLTVWSFLLFIVMTIVTSVKPLRKKSDGVPLRIKYPNFKKRRIISLAKKREAKELKYEEIRKNDPINGEARVEKKLAKDEGRKKKNPEKYRKYEDSELEAMPDVKVLNFTLMNLLDAITLMFLGIVLFAIIIIDVTKVFKIPFEYYDSEIGVLSSTYLVFLSGYILGVIISIIIPVGLYKVLNIITERKTKIYSYIIMYSIFTLAWFIAGMNTISKTYSYFRKTRKFFKSIVIFGDNIYRQILKIDAHSDILNYIAVGILALAIIFFIYTLHTTKLKYRNTAEKRKIKAGWLNGIRWSILAGTSATIGILSMTALYVVADNSITEAPVEDPIIIHDYYTYTDSDGFEVTEDNGYVYIPYTMVEDGHLHRFGYKTEDGYNTRIIVVLKPNMCYGVGLDACETCGEAGYYEKDGDIICKRCGVVMNKATIGMKGGCNPIVISYEEGTYTINSADMECIRIPIPELVKYQMKFSKGAA